MKKSIVSVAILLACIGSVLAYPWEQEKRAQQMFFRDLQGSSPTALELTNNFIEVGDLIVDSSNGDQYLVVNRKIPTFNKVSTNGTTTISSVAATTLTVNSKTAAVGAKATYAMVDYGSASNGEVVVFGTVFSAAPSVTFENLSTSTTGDICSVSSLTTTGFVAVCSPITEHKWIAVGLR